MVTSFPKEKMKIVLLERIHPAARAQLQEFGYQPEVHEGALDGEKLLEVVRDAHVIGVRSRTKLTKEVLSNTKRLLAVGCFSVGTDQVDLNSALELGVPVFNAPYSSTRSVAELTVGCIIMLARRACEKSMLLHQGKWDKSIGGAVEVRGKTVGLVGYGHIGQQVGLLCEALGMQVQFFDIQKKLPLGSARPTPNLNHLLESSEFVSLHVPETEQTKNLINSECLKTMRRGSYLLNLARGKVVDLAAVREALLEKHLAGAAFDVFPEEPAATECEFQLALGGISNVILTPHIGGNTEEAQRNIGREVATSLISFVENGSTEGAVNFPSVTLPSFPNAHRILNIHKNLPGTLAAINRIVSEVGANIESQYLSTYRELGYLIMDLNREVSSAVKSRIEKESFNIRTRVLY
jgi:D-3-phosphoglycerate dehydrogenase